MIPKEGPFDYGHQPGYEWWRTQEMARTGGWTRGDVINFENDPEPLSDRGPEFEPKPPVRDAAMTEIDREGRLPLHYAAMADDVAEVDARLAASDDPNLGDRLGFTPLHLAAQEGSVEAARVLLDHGADVDRVNKFGNTPLFVAVFNSRGRGDLIALLRKRGADPFKVNNSGQTPLGLARLIGNYDVAQFFSDLPS